MNLREGILDALVDDGESIKQIHEYLEYLKIKADKEHLIYELTSLLKEGKIYIRFPPQLENQKTIDLDELEMFWFELTQEGQAEWEKIES